MLGRSVHAWGVVGVVCEGVTLEGALIWRAVDGVVCEGVVCEGVMVEEALSGRTMYVREGQGVACEGVTLGGALIGRGMHVEVVQGVVCEGVMVEGALQRARSQQTLLCDSQEGPLQLDAIPLLQRTSQNQTVHHCCQCDWPHSQQTGPWSETGHQENCQSSLHAISQEPHRQMLHYRLDFLPRKWRCFRD